MTPTKTKILIADDHPIVLRGLRTVLDAWTAGAEASAKDRIGTRHKVTFVMQLPKRYVDEVRGTSGVTSATWMNWFGGKDPRHEKEFFGTMAVDPKSFLEVYDEVSVPADARARSRSERSVSTRAFIIAIVISRSPR